jgi:hypothetical protein
MLISEFSTEDKQLMVEGNTVICQGKHLWFIYKELKQNVCVI